MPGWEQKLGPVCPCAAAGPAGPPCVFRSSQATWGGFRFPPASVSLPSGRPHPLWPPTPESGTRDPEQLNRTVAHAPHVCASLSVRALRVPQMSMSPACSRVPYVSVCSACYLKDQDAAERVAGPWILASPATLLCTCHSSAHEANPRSAGGGWTDIFLS